jgi:hypothetical protein
MSSFYSLSLIKSPTSCRTQALLISQSLCLAHITLSSTLQISPTILSFVVSLLAVVIVQILHIFNIFLPIYTNLLHCPLPFHSLPLLLLSAQDHSGSYTNTLSTSYSVSISGAFTHFRLHPEFASLLLFPTYYSMVSFAALWKSIYICLTFFHQCKHSPLCLESLHHPPEYIFH